MEESDKIWGIIKNKKFLRRFISYYIIFSLFEFIGKDGTFVSSMLYGLVMAIALSLLDIYEDKKERGKIFYGILFGIWAAVLILAVICEKYFN